MTSTLSDTFAHDWAQWHAEHERRRADRHGFLAITALHWLTEDEQTFDDAPGAWHTGPSGVVVDLGPQTIVVDGAEVTGRHGFGVLAERESRYVGWGDAVIEIAKRGGFDVVRPRHPDNPRLAAYEGTPAYPADPAWVLTGRYHAFDEPRPTTVGAAVDELQHVYDAPGEIRFALGGRDLALTAFPGSSGGLMVLFTDATSGVTTYAANRVLALDAVDDGGEVQLDFNRAVNLPCAYTELATCPLPPAQNRLDVAIEAGEQLPTS